MTLSSTLIQITKLHQRFNFFFSYVEDLEIYHKYFFFLDYFKM